MTKMIQKKSSKIYIKRILISFLAIFLIIVCLAPILFVYWNASKTPQEYTTSKFSAPNDFKTFYTNLKYLISKGILKQLLNTVVVSVFCVFLSIIFSSMSGYAFAKLKIPGKNIIFFIIVSLLAMPSQVFLIPIYVMFANAHMINNLFTLIIIYVGFDYAFGTFLMRNFYLKIPNELLESARIDGANNFQIYMKIMLPLGKPAIITLAVLNFFGAWNELLVSLIFNQTTQSRLLTPGLALFRQVEKAGGGLTNWPLIYTGIVFSLIIPLTVYFIFQNRIAAGLTLGAVKE